MKINTIMIVAIYLFFASCVTQHKYNTVYDENIPENESAFIIPSHEIKIILISDNKVNWKQSYSLYQSRFQIPSGMQEIAISLVNATRGNATYNGGEYFFKYNIENGINYYISLDQPENPLKIKLFIQNKTTGKKELISAYPELVYRNIINFNEFDVNE